MVEPGAETKPLQEWLSQADTVEVVRELQHLEPIERAAAFRLLSKEAAREVFEQLEPVYQEELVQALREDQVRELVESMEPDDRARLFEEMPAAVVRRVLAGLSQHEQDMTGLLLGYPAESAGRIMNPEFLALRAGMSVQEALAAVRRRGPDVATVYAIPVTDEHGRLIGMLELEDLVFADPDERIDRVMDDEPHRVHTKQDQEDVARLLQAADLLAMPVVDSEERLVGLVTVDDAMDVLANEEGEDLARAGASEPLGRPYLSVSIFQVAHSRVVWLMLLAIAATLTVNVLSAFEGMLDKIVSLSLFIPLLIGVGGNCGAQSATTVIRAMAVDELRGRDFMRVIYREARVGLLLGLTVAAIGVLPVWLLFGRSLAAVVGLTLIAVCTLASVVGATMPLVAERIHIDPAVVSAPAVTTVVDAAGLLVYFAIARAILAVY